MTAEVLAACLSAGTAVIVAVVSGVIAARAMKATERLRFELSQAESRLRHELARDLAAHESRLRVEGEFRLRLFERSAQAVAGTLETLEAVRAVCMQGALAFRARNKSLPKREPIRSLVQTALFLPEGLEGELTTARGVVHEFGDVLQGAMLHDFDGPNGPTLLDQEVLRWAVMSDKLTDAVEAFERAAWTWKRSAWEDLTLKLVKVEGNSKP